MIKQLIIKFLLRHLDFGSDPLEIDNDMVKKWLKRQGKDQGFIEYLKQREISLRQSAAQKVLDEDERQRIVGQIIELHNLRHNVNRALKAEEE